MRLGPLSLHADARDLHTFKILLVPQQAGAIRWLPPMLFQALCDFIGLLGQTLFDRHIAWALCEPDGDFCTPPLLRLALASGKHIHIPIGLTGWWSD